MTIFSGKPLFSFIEGFPPVLSIPLLLLASAGLHGLFLQLPWPFDHTIQTFEPIAMGADQEPAVMDVEILPSGTLAALLEEKKPTELVASSTAAAPQQPTNRPSNSAATATESVALPPAIESELPSVSDLEPSAAETSKPPESLPDVSELPEETGKTDFGGPADLPRSLDDRLKDVGAYRHESAGILGAIEKVGSLGEHVASIQNILGSTAIPLDDADPIQIPYALEDCLDVAPADGYIILAIDSDGEVVAPARFISSTGYSILDEKAIAQVATHPFPDREETTIYHFNAEVQYPEQCSEDDR